MCSTVPSSWIYQIDESFDHSGWVLASTSQICISTWLVHEKLLNQISIKFEYVLCVQKIKWHFDGGESIEIRLLNVELLPLASEFRSLLSWPSSSFAEDSIIIKSLTGDAVVTNVIRKSTLLLSCKIVAHKIVNAFGAVIFHSILFMVESKPKIRRN